MIVGLALFAVNLLIIGTLLFLGEWLFGSLGWGVLDGVLLLLGIITAAALILFMASARVIATAFLAALLIGVVVSLLLAFDLPRRGAEQAAAAVRLVPDWGPLIAGIVVGAVVGGLFGLIVGWRSGSVLPGLGGGLVLGAVAGAVLGGISFSAQGGVALGTTVGLALWPLLQLGLARGAGVDPGARFERLYPRETIETANDTREWLEAEWAKRRDKLVKR